MYYPNRRQGILFSLATVFTAAVATACTPQKSESKGHADKPVTPYYMGTKPKPSPDIIGTLGGRKVRMSFYKVQDVSYIDTPTMFAEEWKTYKAPPRTYASELDGFGFELNYEKGITRDIRDDKDFYAEQKISGKPWVLVGVERNNDYVQHNNFLDDTLADDLKAKPTLPDYVYVRIPETQYGLERYVVPGKNPKTGQPWRLENSDSKDLFIGRDKAGHVRSYIKCSNKLDVPNPPCSHRFVVKDKIQVTFDMLYNRHRLYDWQRIEQEALKMVMGFVKAAEQDPATH
ncbi:MAG: hypothetical protein Q4A84_02985 [Neisseria sp.]|uniref:hypothetical protein n=1 Tax=Neisseria sp. TaxID=192066 RepID=UPI0026DD469D|nr:hypothetical protein [Neisseria sp.]MDO4640655.1 hypothetical protein [Neisseria sp.]